MSDVRVSGAQFSGLAMLANLRRSRRAGVAGRCIAGSAGLAAALAAYFALAGGGLASMAAAAIGLLAFLVFDALQRRSLAPGYRAVAVDAGGNWMLADAEGWRRFRLQRIWRSPLGWLTLEGSLAPAPGRAGMPRTARLTIWPDSLSAGEWRAVRIAAAWTEQREDGLLVRPQARDPRLGYPA